MEPGGPWESVISAVSAWMESVLLTSYFPKKGIQDICQELKIPIGTYLKKNSWQPSLKDKYFLPWDTLFGFTQICVSWIAILFCLSLFFFFLSLYWICCNIASVVFVFLAKSIWDLRSPTRDQTSIVCFGRWSLNHWTTRGIPELQLLRLWIKSSFSIFFWLTVRICTHKQFISISADRMFWSLNWNIFTW